MSEIRRFFTIKHKEIEQRLPKQEVADPFSLDFDESDEVILLDEKKNKGNNSDNSKVAQTTPAKLPDSIKDISDLGVAAKNNIWHVVYSQDFAKCFNSFQPVDQKNVIKKLNAYIPNIFNDGRWPIDTQPLPAHRYPIIELKLCKTTTGQPLRILYFTKQLGNEKYIIFGAALIHREHNFSKSERELADKSFELF